MTGHTKRLPIGFVPEKRRVAFVRLNVVDDVRRLIATATFGIFAKEENALAVPIAVIAALAGAWARGVEPGLALGVAFDLAGASLAGRNDVAASAYSWGCGRHLCSLIGLDDGYGEARQGELGLHCKILRLLFVFA